MSHKTKSDTVARAIRTLGEGSLQDWVDRVDDRDDLMRAILATREAIAKLQPDRCNNLSMDEAATYLRMGRAGFMKRLREYVPHPIGMTRREDGKPPRQFFARAPLDEWDTVIVPALIDERRVAGWESREGKAGRAKGHLAGFMAVQMLDRVTALHRAMKDLPRAMACSLPWLVNGDAEIVDSALLPLVDEDEIATILNAGGFVAEASLRSALTELRWHAESGAREQPWSDLYAGKLAQEITRTQEAGAKIRKAFLDSRAATGGRERQRA